jgi:alpha-ketoglutarate-dependent taurine dioxygenase
MNQTYPGVVTRFLTKQERRVVTHEEQTPLVIEAGRERSLAFLADFLDHNGPALLLDVARHGALLLRGFAARSDLDFERLLRRIRGMEPINDVMMSEEGRTIVDGTEFVLHTSTLFKTGGAFAHVGFHTENFYVPDVPGYISFFCKQPSLMGGETGLLNTAKLYADLPDSLRAKFESRAAFVSTKPIAALSERYGLPEAEIEAFCEAAGMQVHTENGERVMRMHKPVVARHPVTGEKALNLNFAAELNGHGLWQENLASFAADYRGLRWALHRLGWRRMTHYIETKLGPATKKAGELPRLGDRLTRDEIRLIGTSMRRNFSSFLWKRGDILIVDNLKMAHSGMPGFGKRELRVMIANTVSFPLMETAPGLFAPGQAAGAATLGAQLRELARQRGPMPSLAGTDARSAHVA